MDYEIKVNGQVVGGAWSRSAAHRKALQIGMAQGETLRPSRRTEVEIWMRGALLTTFAKSVSSEDAKYG